jgi:hypothetical protein
VRRETAIGIVQPMAGRLVGTREPLRRGAAANNACLAVSRLGLTRFHTKLWAKNCAIVKRIAILINAYFAGPAKHESA